MTALELFHELPGFDAVGYKTDAQRLVHKATHATPGLDTVGTAVR